MVLIKSPRVKCALVCVFMRGQLTLVTYQYTAASYNYR